MAPCVGMGWSFAGHRVELKAGFGPTLHVVSPDGHAQRLPAKAFELDGHTLTPAQDKLRHWELWCGDERLPTTSRHVPMMTAPDGAKCPVHADAATNTCPRCGVFFCPDCPSLDLTHCAACVVQLQGADEREAMLRRVRDPMVLVSVVASAAGDFHRAIRVIGLVVSFGAWFAVTAAARDARTEREAKLRAWAIYGVSIALMLLLAWWQPF